MGSIDALTVSQLTAIRGQRVLFRGLSFRVASGQVLSLEGPNGSGKTTLLRVLAGFLKPAAGTIALGTVEDAEERGKRVGWLGHHDGAKPQLTPREILEFFAALYRRPVETAGALDAVGLATLADLPCQYLSAGQKKRLALARLLLAERPVWLLDEPLSALDAQGRRLTVDLLDRHVRAGGIVVAATHEPLGVACERLALGEPA